MGGGTPRNFCLGLGDHDHNPMYPEFRFLVGFWPLNFAKESCQHSKMVKKKLKRRQTLEGIILPPSVLGDASPAFPCGAAPGVYRRFTNAAVF